MIRPSFDMYGDAGSEDTEPAFLEIHVAGGQCKFVPLRRLPVDDFIPDAAGEDTDD